MESKDRKCIVDGGATVHMTDVSSLTKEKKSMKMTDRNLTTTEP